MESCARNVIHTMETLGLLKTYSHDHEVSIIYCSHHILFFQYAYKLLIVSIVSFDHATIIAIPRNQATPKL